jgi:hypothetical protein
MGVVHTKSRKISEYHFRNCFGDLKTETQEKVRKNLEKINDWLETTGYQPF